MQETLDERARQRIDANRLATRERDAAEKHRLGLDSALMQTGWPRESDMQHRRIVLGVTEQASIKRSQGAWVAWSTIIKVQPI